MWETVHQYIHTCCRTFFKNNFYFNLQSSIFKIQINKLNFFVQLSFFPFRMNVHTLHAPVKLKIFFYTFCGHIFNPKILSQLILLQ